MLHRARPPRYRGTRRRPHPIARAAAVYLTAANPLWTLLVALFALLSVDVLILAYAAGVSGSWTGGARDIFAVVFGLVAGGLV